MYHIYQDHSETRILPVLGCLENVQNPLRHCLPLDGAALRHS